MKRSRQYSIPMPTSTPISSLKSLKNWKTTNYRIIRQKENPEHRLFAVFQGFYFLFPLNKPISILLHFVHIVSKSTDILYFLFTYFLVFLFWVSICYHILSFLYLYYTTLYSNTVYKANKFINLLELLGILKHLFL